MVALPSLADIQGQSFGRPTVLVTQQVGGVEDIPVRTGASSRSSPETQHHIVDSRSDGPHTAVYLNFLLCLGVVPPVNL